MKIFKTDKKIPSPELRGSIDNISFPAFVDIKVDGEFCFVHVNDGNSFTVNKYGKIRKSFPDLFKIEHMILSRGFKSATFMGELYCNDGKLGALYDLLKMKESDDLKIYPFDIIELDSKDLREKPLVDRLEIIREILSNNKVTKVHFAETKEKALEIFEKSKDKGYEGVVVKSINSKIILDICDWVKLKSKDRTDYEIHIIDPTQERIEILAPNLSSNTPNLHAITVGVKCPNKYKKFIKPGDMVTIEHQGVLASGSLRHPVLIPNPFWKCTFAKN